MCDEIHNTLRDSQTVLITSDVKNYNYFHVAFMEEGRGTGEEKIEGCLYRMLNPASFNLQRGRQLCSHFPLTLKKENPPKGLGPQFPARTPSLPLTE